MFHNSNVILSKLTNHINLNIYYHGHSVIGLDWVGKVANLQHSRLWYTIKGNSYITFNNKRIFLPPGKWVLLPTNLSYDFDCPDEMEQLYFHFKLCSFDEIDILSNYTEPIIFDFYDVDTEFLINSVHSTNIVDGFKIRQKVFEIIIHLLETHPINIQSIDYSPCVHEALNYINQNLSMELTISEISQHLQISNSTLVKHFRKELKLSVNEYISNRIMSEAEHLLLTTTKSILAISDRYGFTNQFYFSRRFKKFFGISPREYRKNFLSLTGNNPVIYN